MFSKRKTTTRGRTSFVRDHIDTGDATLFSKFLDYHWRNRQRQSRSSRIWNEMDADCQDAFEELKQMLICAPIWDYLSVDGRFILDTDASNIGIGGILFQVQRMARRQLLATLAGSENGSARIPVIDDEQTENQIRVDQELKFVIDWKRSEAKLRECSSVQRKRKIVLGECVNDVTGRTTKSSEEIVQYKEVYAPTNQEVMTVTKTLVKELTDRFGILLELPTKDITSGISGRLQGVLHEQNCHKYPSKIIVDYQRD
ncbi:hypothetical protein Trydic_g16262 [Trypoxylus dichotomus]